MLIVAFLTALACLVWPSSRRLTSTSMEVRTAAVTRVKPWPGHRLARRRGAARAGSPWVADFAEVVAVGLDAGLDLGSAALAAARSPGVVTRAGWLVSRLEAAVAEGRGVATLLPDEVPLTADDRRDLTHLVDAWRLAEQVGAAAAAVTTAAAVSIRGHHAARARTAVVVAGPRASMALLSALPLAGPAAAALVGIGPARLYASGRRGCSR